MDLSIHTAAGERIFAEFKFTEAGFGGCSVFRDGDCDGRNPAGSFDLCYLHRIGRRYWPLMEKHGLLNGSLITDSQCTFTNLYQAYRLILSTLEQGGHFLLLYDERNPEFIRDHLQEPSTGGRDYVGAMYRAYKDHLCNAGVRHLPCHLTFHKYVWVLKERRVSFAHPTC